MSSPSSIVVFGLYEGLLLPHRLGGLCRGKEWWIEGPFLKGKQALHRTVLSAAQFFGNDILSPDNQFGLDVVEHSLGEILQHVLLNHRVVAIIEDGPLVSPENACGRETYTLSRMGLSLRTGFARWEQECKTVEDFKEALEFGSSVFLIDPQPREEEEEWLPSTPVDVEDSSKPPTIPEGLRNSLQWLLGMRNSIRDDHRYVPQALWEVTEFCAGVLVLHADRNSDCVCVYSAEPLNLGSQVHSIATINEGSEYIIPCTVPTMLLRWKRALFEACDQWDGPCPEALRNLVPVVEEPPSEEEESVPADEEAMSTEEEDLPLEEDAEPSKEDNSSLEEDAEPSKEDTSPIEEDAEPSKEDTSPIEEDAEPSKEDTSPIEEDGVSTKGEDGVLENDVSEQER